MATDAEAGLFSSRVLAEVGRHAERLPKVPLVGFMAVAGQSYDGGLMVVGRAVNRWAESILPSDLATTTGANRYARGVQQSVSGNGACPMQWVTDFWEASAGYNTKRSAFWRAIRGVVEKLCIADVQQASWPSHLVWSNLYKISPHEKGGNPSNRLCDIQLPGCIELLSLELKIYKPSRLLFLTGDAWANDFLPLMKGLPEADGQRRQVWRSGNCTLNDGNPARCVIASHPQGKPEDDWVREVVEAFDGAG